ncbi:kell blood group glycoprotein homolog [Haemaphysalis longicornis]
MGPELAWDEPGPRGKRYSPRAVRRLASLEDRVTDDSSETLVSTRHKPYLLRKLRHKDDDYGEESEYSSSSSGGSTAARAPFGWGSNSKTSPAPGSVFAVVSTAVILLCSGALLYLYVNWSNDRLGHMAGASQRAVAVAVTSSDLNSSPVSGTTSATDNASSPNSTTEAAVTASQKSVVHSACLSRFCLAHSAYLKGYLDWAADPCVDFYDFVCHRRRQSSDAQLVARTERALVEAMRGSRAPPLLEECWKGSEATLRRQLRELLEEVGLGGWPFRNNRGRIDVWRITAALSRDVGLDALLTVETLQLQGPPSTLLVAVGEPDLLIGRHKERRLPRWYTDAAAAAFRIIGDSKEANASAGVREFSEKLAEVSSSRGEEDFAASRYRLATVASYSAYKPLLSQVLRGLITVRDRTRLLVKSDRYLRALRSVLQMTRSSDVLNYLGFRLIVHLAPLLGDDFRELWDLRIRQLAGGHEPRPAAWPRWRRCLRQLEPLLQDRYMATFGHLLDTKLELASLASLSSELKGRLVSALPTLPWLAPADRPRARNVLASVRVRFFYPPVRTGAQQHGVHARPGRLLAAYRDACRASYAARLAGRWKGSVFDTWPRWDWASGSVFVPAALLDLKQLSEESLGVQVPRLASRLARALLEAVHQRSHAFGRLEWSMNTSAALHRTEGCLDAQYGSLGDDGLASARRWLDNAAIVPAQAQFGAYLRERRVALGDSAGLQRGLDTRHLFHVLLAASLCAGTSDRTDQARTRVNQPLRNSASFAKLWNCSYAAPMNPSRRCAIWNGQ